MQNHLLRALLLQLKKIHPVCRLVVFCIHSHPKGREFVFHAANSHDLANWMWLLKARIEKGKGTFRIHSHYTSIRALLTTELRIVQKSWCHQETTIQRGKTNRHLIFYLSFYFNGATRRSHDKTLIFQCIPFNFTT